MRHRLAIFVASFLLVGGATCATTASAGNSFAVSIALPGLALGAGSNSGFVGIGGNGYGGYYAPSAVAYAAPVTGYYAASGYRPVRAVYVSPFAYARPVRYTLRHAPYYSPVYGPYIAAHYQR
jgi:hypothetical protein